MFDTYPLKINMQKKILVLLTICLGIFSQCKERPKLVTSYDNQNRLEKIVNDIVNYDLTKPGTNSVVILLQSEDCICTEENMALSKDVILSKKYAEYQTVLITKGKQHKFLSMLTHDKVEKIKLYSDTSNYLFSHGYITTTDKIIVYHNGNVEYFEDMHLNKPADIRKKIL